MAINLERARARRQNEKAKIERGISLDQFVPELAERGIYLEPKQWERKLSATSGALKAATALALEIEIDSEAMEMVSQSLGVKSILLGMTEAESKATATLDMAAVKMISSEPDINLNHWMKIASVFHPGYDLSEERVAELVVQLEGATLREISLSQNETSEDIVLKLSSGREIPLNKGQYLSLIAQDIFERARDERDLWDDTLDSHVSYLALALRKQLNVGLLIQRSDVVLEKLQSDHGQDLAPEILAMFAVERGVGFHGTGEENVFIQMPDGSVVETVKMKECDGCAHGAEETIKNLAPDISIREMVDQYQESHQPSQEDIVQPKVAEQPGIIFFPGRLIFQENPFSSSMSSHDSEGSGLNDEGARGERKNHKVISPPRKSHSPQISSLGRETQTSDTSHVSKKPTTLAGGQNIKSKPTTEGSHDTTIKNLMNQRSSGPSNVISNTQPPMEISYSRYDSYRSGLRKPVIRRASIPKFATMPPMMRSESVVTWDKPRRGGSPSGESPYPTTGPNVIGGRTKHVRSVAILKPATIEARATGQILATAFENRVVAREEKQSISGAKKEGVVEKKISSRASIVVDIATNAQLNDARSTTTSPTVTSPKIGSTVIKKARHGTSKARRRPLSLALSSPSKGFDVTNTFSAREMVKIALGA